MYYHRLSLLSCDGREGKFSISKLCIVKDSHCYLVMEEKGSFSISKLCIITDSHCYLVMEEKGSFPLVSCVLSQTLTVIL